MYVPNSIDRHTLQCVCEKKIQKIITWFLVLTFLVNSSLCEVNFSNWFYCNSDCRFRFLSKKYLHKLSSFLKNSNGYMVKTLNFGGFLHFWLCPFGDIQKIIARLPAWPFWLTLPYGRSIFQIDFFVILIADSDSSRKSTYTSYFLFFNSNGNFVKIIKNCKKLR